MATYKVEDDLIRKVWFLFLERCQILTFEKGLKLDRGAKMKNIDFREVRIDECGKMKDIDPQHYIKKCLEIG